VSPAHGVPRASRARDTADSRAFRFKYVAPPARKLVAVQGFEPRTPRI
jgi:hypothetical protein